MRCLHPITRRYRDLMGQEHSFSCSCGHCIACLHNAHDSWGIRLLETNNAHKCFVYDTLTFDNKSIPRVTVDLNSYGSRLSDDVISLLSRYSSIDTETGEYSLFSPSVDRSLVRDWIRQARELFYYHHGYRLKLKYFMVWEYGPRTSRSHIHLLMWGVDKPTYIKYFKKPWRRKYGFTCTKFIDGGTDKDRRCIAKYVSKYVSKGVFESPLVKCGFSPKPIRHISHGIGEEYLNRPCFAYYKSVVAQFMKNVSVSGKLRDSDKWRQVYIVRDLIMKDICEGWFKPPSDEDIKNITTYYDNMGLPHALPRYYRQKLLNLFNPNVFSYVIQTHVLARSELHHNTRLAEFARSLGYYAASVSKGAFLGLGKKLYNVVSDKFAVTESLQAKAKAKARYIELKNHYKRSFNLAFS